ncbi:hypothetical protein [Oerskovia paurometabola]|uniref:Uncharacterized protein n=1 Tax=Oerskovia paurometabola TaxID=162170 RepID=A0ABW1X7Z7_9CELL|nr:hypothetical protein [Oerskovia paurometabola]MBM7497810.1 hypothetical protein [Oerskovia paurometabola]
MRPTKYLTKWSARDRALAEGHLLREASLGSHGLPWHIASDPNRTFAVEEVVDHAAATLEEVQEEYRKGDNLSPGLRLLVVDQGLRARPLEQDEARNDQG